MRKRIGVFCSRLSHQRPRGVHRVARRVAEYLASQANSDEFEFLCLTRRVKNEHEITYKACGLSDWLAQHPPATAPPPAGGPARRSWFADFLKAAKRKTKRTLAPYVPHLLRPFCYFCYRAMIALLFGWIARIRKARTTLMTARGQGRAARLPHLKRFAVTLNELDLLISFENHEEIWRLPVENYSCKTVGWFYDVITLRVADEARWNLDHLEKALSSFTLKADRIVCGSSSAEKDLHTFYPRARGKTCVIYDGHDVSRFQPSGDAGALDKLLDDVRLDRHIPYVVTLGGIEPRKNTINLLRACIHLRKRRPELSFQLLLVGEVHGLPGFAMQVERARQFLPVVHAGYRSDEDVARLLTGARALLFPSLWEGFGIPPLEAMTAGALVITSDLASMPEVCGENAIYCDPYEPADIAATLAVCLEMAEQEREERVQAARRHAARFTWERMGEQVIQLLRAELAGDTDDIRHSPLSPPGRRDGEGSTRGQGEGQGGGSSLGHFTPHSSPLPGGEREPECDSLSLVEGQ
jgi:glycosyltransferase involved in cell wall biosynthesis